MSSDREMYLARAQAEVERAREKLKHYAGDCEDCRWIKRDRYGAKPICQFPAVVAAAFNVTNANARRWFQECDEQRDTKGTWGPVLCGPNGTFFEER